MYGTVLVAYDFSRSADAAFTAAARVVETCGATRLRLVHVHEELTADVQLQLEHLEQGHLADKLLAAARQELEAWLREHEGAVAGISAELEVRSGHPGEEVLAAAEAVSADLIVCGASGKGAITRWLLGSTAQRLVQLAPCDVLVVHQQETAEPGFSEAVVGVDFSSGARRAFERARALGATSLHLVHALSVPTLAAVSGIDAIATDLTARTREELEGWRASLDAGEATLSHEVVMGRPSSALEEIAESRGADLIAVGCVGRSGVARALIGNTAERIIKRARRSVLVVR